MSDNDNRQNSSSIQTLRGQINDVDAKLLSLLTKRRSLARSVAEFKSQKKAPIRDSQREEELLTELIQQGIKHGLDAHYITKIFHAIIDDSIAIQQRILQQIINDNLNKSITCGYLGVPGSYSYLAAQKHFVADSEQIEFQGYRDFQTIIESVMSEDCRYGILPIENTTSGGITDVYDLLLKAKLHIVGEEKYPINHCLLTNQETTPEKLEVLYTHPEVYSQCTNFIHSLKNCEIIYASSSANAAKRVKENHDRIAGALASKQSSELYDLILLKDKVANTRTNSTRFVIVGKEAEIVAPSLPCKTSIVLSTHQVPGALAETLLVFRDHQINITKLESRPIPENPWEELFYVDIEGNQNQPQITEAINQLSRLTRFVRVLGSYPSSIDDPTQVSPENLLVSIPKQTKITTPINQATQEVSVDKTFLLSTRQHKTEDSQFSIKNMNIGGNSLTTFVQLSQPTSFQTTQLFIEKLINLGVQVFEVPSQYLSEMEDLKNQWGLALIVTVEDIEDVHAITHLADAVKIPAQRMTDVSLAAAVGHLTIPIILERNPFCSVNEWLATADQIMQVGNQQVILCETGSRTYQQSERPVIDFELLQEARNKSHLPLFIAPSHCVHDQKHLLPLVTALKQFEIQGIILDTSQSSLSSPEIFSDIMKALYLK
ncbi:MAG: chorismate mutase [Pseudomonadota bacterium]